MDDRFYVEKRRGRFLGHFTHSVKDRENRNAIICVSTEWSCEMIAEIMNSAICGVSPATATAL